MKTLALLSLVVLAGCTVVRPSSKPWTKGRLRSFSHADFDATLKRFVDERGLVDYAALRVYRDKIETYYKQLSYYSPDSHPQLFPTEADKLAYWINAYNASAIKIVLGYYPIRSVTEISTLVPTNFLSPSSSFLVGHRILLGGDTFSLSSLENQRIRSEFEDPRVHFVVNGAARGYPKLGAEALTGERLEEQLEEATRQFFADDRNVRVDHATETVYLSSILNWYKGDFLDWMERSDPESEASLLAYAELYAPVEKSSDLAMAQEYHVEFIAHDWRLNDSNAE